MAVNGLARDGELDGVLAAIRGEGGSAAAFPADVTAQIGLTRAWARELAPDGITVNTVAPGFIPVERHAGEPVEAYLATVPIGRMGTPEDIAHTVSFLASDDAGFVTGQRIVVDGGRALT